MKRRALSFVIVFLIVASQYVFAESTPAVNTEPTKPPKLSSILSRMVVFLYADIEPREKAPVLGTGFIIGVAVPGLKDKAIPFIVTAKHVIAGLKSVAVRYSSTS